MKHLHRNRPLLERFASLGAREYSLLLLLISFVLLLPFLALPVPSGHDLLFHLNRIEGLAEAYRHGNAFPAVFYNVFGGIGYGTPLFYGNLAAAFPAALRALGVPLLASWKINAVLVTLLAALSCYLCARAMLKNDFAAFLMSVVFVFSGYFAADLFFRATLGEMTAFIFIPAAFLGLDGVLCERRRLWPLLPLGLSLILYCHLISALITAFGLLLYALANVSEFVRKPKKLLLLAASAGLFLLFSAFSIFPMLEQLSSARFLATDGSSAGAFGTLLERAMPWWALASDVNIPVSILFRSSANIWIPNGLGLAFPLMLFAAVFFGKRANPRRTLPALVLCALTLLLCSELFPWRIGFFQSALGVIQFPWRFLLLAVFFIALYAGEFAAALVKPAARDAVSSGTERLPARTNSEQNPRAARVVCALFTVFSLFSFLMTEGPKAASGLSAVLNRKISEYAYTDNVGTGEYLPSGLNAGTFPNLQQGASCDDPAVTVEDLGETDGVRAVSFFGGGADDNAAVTVSLFFRTPVQATAELPDGSSVPLAYTQTESGVRIETGGLSAGTIRLVCVPAVRASASDLAASAQATLGYGSAAVVYAGANSGDWIEAPLLWYKGYQARFTAADGAAAVLPVSAGEYGLCRVDLTNAPAGTLAIRYERTPAQKISLAVSALSFLGAAVWGAVLLVNERKIKFAERTGKTDVTI